MYLLLLSIPVVGQVCTHGQQIGVGVYLPTYLPFEGAQIETVFFFRQFLLHFCMYCCDLYRYTVVVIYVCTYVHTYALSVLHELIRQKSLKFNYTKPFLYRCRRCRRLDYVHVCAHWWCTWVCPLVVYMGVSTGGVHVCPLVVCMCVHWWCTCVSTGGVHVCVHWWCTCVCPLVVTVDCVVSRLQKLKLM